MIGPTDVRFVLNIITEKIIYVLKQSFFWQFTLLFKANFMFLLIESRQTK